MDFGLILLGISTFCMLYACWNIYQVYILLDELKKSLRSSIDSLKG